MSFAALLKHSPVLTDGAWGTQLVALGLPAGACPDEWNLQHPEIVEQVPLSYVAAGSQVVLTNTFRANRLALGGGQNAGAIAEINAAGVAISRRAAGGRALVFGSIGPSGKLLLAGDVTEAELFDAFREQACALAQAGADALVLETMADLAEALVALRAAQETGLPVVASMVFDSGQERDRTMMGVAPEEAAEALTAAGADAVGANCGQGIEGYGPICRRLRAATDRPLWIKPNAGTPQVSGDRTVYPQTPRQFASHVPELVAAGANFIGGCCGTNPEFIQAVRRVLTP